jgi:hypothetical protein
MPIIASGYNICDEATLAIRVSQKALYAVNGGADPLYDNTVFP